MKHRLELGLKAGVAALLLLNILIGCFSYRITTHLLDFAEHASLPLQIREKASGLLCSMDDLETGMRGYVITGNEQSLEPYSNSMAGAGKGDEEFFGLLANDPGETQAAVELKQLVANERAITRHAVELRCTAGFAPAAQWVDKGDGKRGMDRIRQLIGDIVGTENLLISAHELQGRQTKIDAQRILWVIGTGSVLALMVLAVEGHYYKCDTCRRRSIEEKHRQMIERFRILVEGAKDYAILTLDNEGLIQSWNTGSQNIKGYTAEEIIGKSFSCFYTPEAAEQGKPQAELQIARETGKFEEDGWRVRKDGSRFWANVIIRPLQDSTGKQIGFSKITRDLTERKRAERQLIAAKETAETANRAKSEFLANMSHEIRTPMTAIMGFSNMLLAPDQDEAERAESVQAIRRNGLYLLELINGILDLSKIEEGHMLVESVPCDLTVMLADLLAIMRPRAVEKGLEFEISLSCPIPRIIHTDPIRLRQILVNLLANAIKFTFAGKVTMTLCSEGPEPGHGLSVKISDTGIGIAAEQLPRLFHPFTQADESVTRKFGGTGLGLTISRRLARLLGGDIVVKSEAGVGSTFEMHVAEKPSTKVEMLAVLPQTLQPPVAVPDLQEDFQLHGRILIVEDGRDNQRLISMHLRSSGAEVAIAENGQIAVDMVAEGPFDLIFMDMQMPIKDGYTATTELRRNGCTTPIVALTAYAMATDRKKCLDSGCTDYLTKPIDRQILLKAASKYMENSTSTSPANATPGPAQASAAEPIKSTFATQPRMLEIINEFVNGLPGEVRKMTDSLQKSDLASLRQVIHQLRGAAGGYGFAAITQRATSVEKSIDSSSDVESITSQTESFMSMIRRIEGYDESKASAAA